LNLVTWNQQEDKHWFGGRIPGPVQKVEIVKISTAYEGYPGSSYETYEGPTLQKTSDLDAAGQQPHIAAITALKAATMP
jgi:hypothetical protein